MKKQVFIIEGLAFILIGIVFLFNSFSSITGAVVLENVSVNLSGLVGIVFVVVGILVMMAGRRITPKKDLASLLTIKEKTFRRKLVNWLIPDKDIDVQKIALLLPRYEKVKYTGDHVAGSRVYQGERGRNGEYFTVDLSPTHQKFLHIGGQRFKVPTHIDIQERDHDGNYHQKSDNKGNPIKYHIDWDKMISDAKAKDIEDYFLRRPKKHP